MPGYTDKSTQYLRLAVENYKRAGAAESPELKAKFIEIAAGYCALALQLDEPAQMASPQRLAARQNAGDFRGRPGDGFNLINCRRVLNNCTAPAPD